MAKNRKIPMAVRHQVKVTRAQEMQEAGVATISPREALTQARLAGRKARNEAIAARMAEAGPSPVKPTRAEARAKPAPQFNLIEGSLVTLAKSTIAFRLGAETNPYIPLQKGAVGVLMYRDLVSRGTSPRGRGRRGTPLCHVMVAGSIVELPQSMVRGCDAGDEN